MTTTAPAPTATATPTLPDGLVVVVKEECETCRMVVPVLAELAAEPARRHRLHAGRPGLPARRRRRPRRRPGRSAGTTTSRRCRRSSRWSTASRSTRTVGWDRARVGGAHRRRAASAPDLPEFRPGCGSLSVDPNLVDELRVRFSGSLLRSRRVEIADLEDEMEAMFDRGWTDGLPVVPPTEARVLRDAGGHDPSARRGRGRRAARPRAGHRREGGHQRGDGRLQARVPAGGAGLRRGGLHRRVQHPRRAGHHDAGRARS